MEALLKVTADVRSPARPWATIGREPVKLFLGDSVNAIGDRPSRVTLVTRNGVPDMVLLDDDAVRFRGKAYSALVAVCKAICGKSSPHDAVLDLGELLADPIAVSALGGHTSRPNLEIYLRDHLQSKHCLGNAVSIENGALKFHCEIHQIEHSELPPA
jgi:hypothetical protein